MDECLSVDYGIIPLTVLCVYIHDLSLIVIKVCS